MEEPAKMTCILHLDTEISGWHKIITYVFSGIQGLTYNIDAPRKLAYISGNVDPLLLIKKLCKAETHATLYRIDYGYEDDPNRPRNPAPRMSCSFFLDTEQAGWHKKILLVLRTIQGVSFTIDAVSKFGYLSGNIDSAELLKKLAKAEKHVTLYRVDYGYKPPPGHGILKALPAEEEAPLALPPPEKEGKKDAEMKDTSSKPKSKPQASTEFSVSSCCFL